jgi:hypothetical protein
MKDLSRSDVRVDSFGGFLKGELEQEFPFLWNGQAAQTRLMGLVAALSSVSLFLCGCLRLRSFY